MDKNTRYIVGVSGGSDSMVLLQFLLLADIEIIVAHVNYKRRKSADRDQKLVVEYCLKHNLKYEVLIADDLTEGNFQAKAREVRYQFFKELLIKYNAEGVIVAHHQDDVLETYLLQKESGRIPLYWGIRDIVEIEGLKIIRPLLDFSKADIVEYAHYNNLPYAEDESNQSTRYRRNQLRHEVLAQLSEKEKQDLLTEIDRKNEELESFHNEVKQLVDNQFNQIKYKMITEDKRLEVLRQYLLNNDIDARHFSLDYLKELDLLLGKDENTNYEIGNKILCLDYGIISISDKSENYSYYLYEIEEVETPYFQVSREGPSTCAVTVTKADFPLCIRNWKQGDAISLRYGHKKVSRFLIDRKISLAERMKWPVVENSRGELILVPGIGCEIEHYSNKANMFVVK